MRCPLRPASSFHFGLQKIQKGTVKLVALPIFVLGPRALGVEDAERTAKIPESPSTVQTAQHVERVVKPGENHVRWCVLVATHFAEVNAYSLLRQFAPGLEGFDQRLPVANHFPTAVL